MATHGVDQHQHPIVQIRHPRPLMTQSPSRTLDRPHPRRRPLPNTAQQSVLFLSHEKLFYFSFFWFLQLSTQIRLGERRVERAEIYFFLLRLGLLVYSIMHVPELNVLSVKDDGLQIFLFFIFYFYIIDIFKMFFKYYVSKIRLNHPPK